jgi:hypothetical protein
MEADERIFDIDSLADKWKINPSLLDKFVREAREEFPNDEMMVELHVLRALRRSQVKKQH